MTDVVTRAARPHVRPTFAADRVVDLTAPPPDDHGPPQASQPTGAAPEGEPPSGTPDSTVPPPPPPSPAPPGSGERPPSRWRLRRRRARQPRQWSIGPPETARQRAQQGRAEPEDPDAGRQTEGTRSAPPRQAGASGSDAGLLRQLFGS